MHEKKIQKGKNYYLGRKFGSYLANNRCEIPAFQDNFNLKYIHYYIRTITSYQVTYPAVVHNFVGFIVLVRNSFFLTIHVTR